jgi:hypothetical protein
MPAVSGEPWTRLLGQDSWHMTARVHPGQETENKTARTGQGDRKTVKGQLAKDIWDKTTQTGQPGHVLLDG